MPLKPINTKARLDNLKTDPHMAYMYARDVIKGRWPEAEPYIMKDAMISFYYAKRVIKGRWPEAEYIIGDSPWGTPYENVFNMSFLE